MIEDFVKGNIIIIDDRYSHVYSYSSGRVMVQWGDNPMMSSIHSLDELMRLVKSSISGRYRIEPPFTSMRNVK